MRLGSATGVPATSGDSDSIHLSKTVAQAADPRVTRSRAAIAAAFIALLHRRPYARIRVSDITRRARVGRATFYAHYESKDALLAAQLAEVVMPMLVLNTNGKCLVDATRLYAHVLGSRTVFRALCAGPECYASERIVEDVLEAHIAAHLTRRPMWRPVAPVAATFVPRLIAAIVLAQLRWALEQEPAPAPVSLQEAMQVLIAGAVSAHG